MCREFKIKSTTGEQTNIFVGPDKSMCTIRRTAACRSIRRALQEARSGRRFFTDMAKGEISSNWGPLIKIKPVPQSDTPEIAWDPANIVAEGLSQSELGPIAQQAIAGPSPTVWSSKCTECPVARFLRP
eukprot:5655413-Pyramimonas_sp.AAC.1